MWSFASRPGFLPALGSSDIPHARENCLRLLALQDITEVLFEFISEIHLIFLLHLQGSHWHATPSFQGIFGLLRGHEISQPRQTLLCVWFWQGISLASATDRRQ